FSPYDNDLPYDNDFDPPNLLLDFLNSYITNLNEKYKENCKNIFSDTANKILEVLLNTGPENKVSNSTKFIKYFKYRCYLKINITIKEIIKEIFDKEMPISIYTNSFLKLYYSNFDKSENKNVRYNIFRTNEQEKCAIISLINNIEHKYGVEANKRAKSAYNNFLGKLNSKILALMKKISCNQINNKKILYQKIKSVFKVMNNSINFTNDQITETDTLIIYKVLKSISKFLKRTSEDQYLSQVFPEFKILNILYHSRIKDHQLSDRKFHAGIFLKKIVKQKLNEFKDKYQSVQYIKNFDDDYLKEILEIRVFYIFNLFKFLNIKKPYLLAYILLSIKSYLLKSEKIKYIEKNEFEKIFSLYVINLDEILNSQVFMRIKPFL
ncbi:hypothetical protein DMUE_4793, partial [Dictyocoela muelleri]